jgi:hypothetical protein
MKMSLKKEDKEILLKLLDDCHSFDDLKLVVRSLIVLEDFPKDDDKK